MFGLQMTIQRGPEVTAKELLFVCDEEIWDIWVSGDCSDVAGLLHSFQLKPMEKFGILQRSFFMHHGRWRFVIGSIRSGDGWDGSRRSRSWNSDPKYPKMIQNWRWGYFGVMDFWLFSVRPFLYCYFCAAIGFSMGASDNALQNYLRDGKVEWNSPECWMWNMVLYSFVYKQMDLVNCSGVPTARVLRMVLHMLSYMSHWERSTMHLMHEAITTLKYLDNKM